MEAKYLLLAVVVLGLLMLIPSDANAQCGSCSVVGQQKCSGQFILTCVEILDGCLDFDYTSSEATFCTAGCIEIGSGVAQCVDEGPTSSSCSNCDQGATKCDNNRVSFCRDQGNGCFKWETNPDFQLNCAASGAVCKESGSVAFCDRAFSPSCVDECLAGQSVCAGSGSTYRHFCGDYDSDSCLEFPPAGFTPLNQEFCKFGCQGVGSRIAACKVSPDSLLCDTTRTCRVENATRCDFYANDIQKCEKLANGCLEWTTSGIQHCPGGCEEIGSNIAICSENFGANVSSHFSVLFDYLSDNPHDITLTNDTNTIWLVDDDLNNPVELQQFDLRTGRKIFGSDISSVAGTSAESLVWDGEFLWVITTFGTDKALKFFDNGTYAGENRTIGGAGWGNLRASFDGTNFYSVNPNLAGGVQIRKYNSQWTSLENLTQSQSIGGPGFLMQDMAWDGNNFLVLSIPLPGDTEGHFKIANFSANESGNLSFRGFVFDITATLGDQFNDTDSIIVNPNDKSNILLLTRPNYISGFGDGNKFDGHIYNISLDEEFLRDRCVLGTSRCIGIYPFAKTTTCVVDKTGTHTIWSEDPADITECQPVTEECLFDSLTQEASCTGVPSGECAVSLANQCTHLGASRCVDSTFVQDCVVADFNPNCKVWNSEVTSCGGGKCEQGLCFDCVDQCNLGDQRCEIINGVHYALNCTEQVSDLFSSVCLRFVDVSSELSQGHTAACPLGCTEIWDEPTNRTHAECKQPSSDAIDLRNYLEMQSENLNLIAGNDTNKVSFIIVITVVAALFGFVVTRRWEGAAVPGMMIIFIGILSAWLHPIFFGFIAVVMALIVAKVIFMGD